MLQHLGGYLEESAWTSVVDIEIVKSFILIKAQDCIHQKEKCIEHTYT